VFSIHQNGDHVKRYRPHVFVAVALAIVVLGGLHNGLRYDLADFRFAGQSRDPSGDIVVVAIDAPSIDKVGVWPWPRALHAELIRQLHKAGVQDIALDVDFSTPSEEASDREFAEALKAAGGSIVLASFQQPRADQTYLQINRPLPQFADHSWPALVNVQIGKDGLVRRYPFGEKLAGTFLPSMAAVLAGQYVEHRDPFLIDYSIRAARIPKVSYADVLHGDEATLRKLNGKKVIVGATALELGDRFSVPNSEILPGPVLQAIAGESLLQSRTLQWTSGLVTAAGLVLLVLAMLATWRRVSAEWRVATLLALAIGVEAGAFLLQAMFPLILDTALFHIGVFIYIAVIAIDEIVVRSLLGRISESRFHRVAMTLSDGLICTDPHLRITVWNDGAAAIFGYSARDMIGKHFEAIFADRGKVADLTISEAAALPVGNVTEFGGRRSNGDIFPMEASYSGWQGTEGYHLCAVVRDISLRKQEAEKLRYLAEHDRLTGLANRYTLANWLADMMTGAETKAEEVALIIVGLDGFQQINDTLGHSNGDLLLSSVAERLRMFVGPNAILARLSGDEFALAFSCSGASASVAEVEARLRSAFEEPVVAAGRSYDVKLSIGAAAFPSDGRTPDELISNGHIALSYAKATNRGAYAAFEKGMRQTIEMRLTLESEIAQAAERGEFELFYQPQVHLGGHKLIGAEALIRWRHPVRGIVSPAEFMPVVNTSGHSQRIANWVLQTACRQARTWELAGHPLRVGINLSPSQLHSGDLAEAVAAALAATGVTSSLIELEVTEDILIADERRVLDIFRHIQKLGVRLVFDDFGTGYASLSYLKKFPLDGLKIDRSFVCDLLTDADDAAIVSSTIGLSRQLGLSVIAEGIEDSATAELLARMGCEEGQGYFFGKPMPAVSLEETWLRNVAA
jgi:diguanylate cyclase (GGDEF)-like protein/PAS domain S-box-containing protein